MRFSVYIDCDGDAFAEDPTPEIARLLKQIAQRMEQDGESCGGLRDTNGNSCGGFEYK